MRVAIATQNRENADGHFASTRTFVFYEVDEKGFDLVDEVSFDLVTQEQGQGITKGDTNFEDKIRAIQGSVMVFVTAIGAPAAARLIKANVYPVKLMKPEPIVSVLQRVQTMLKENPPPWLRKFLAAQESARVAAG